MPKGQRSIRIPTTESEKKEWKKKLERAAEHVVKEGRVKRPQIDTWAAVDEWGFTPEEFRLLYCIARHENWKTLSGGQSKERKNGCYASAETLRRYTGISRNKIFEILKLFQEANIIERLEEARSRTPEKRGRKSGATLAGWTYEYTILPITAWMPPWELAEKREQLKKEKEISRQRRKKGEISVAKPRTA